MNENLVKVIKENKKLKRFIEEIYHAISDSVYEFQTDLQFNSDNLNQIQNEIVFAFINAKSNAQSFDFEIFKNYLTSQGKNVDELMI